MYRLRDAGHSAFLVGGGVRDLLLGKIPKDFDISTNARPGQIRSIFKNSRIIGRRFRLVQVFFRGGKIIEVSTLRCRSEYDILEKDAVLPSNNTFGTLPEDAFRRDLTINGLFYEIEKFTVIDYVGGVADLKNKTIRIIGDPDRRITRDPVRMMRAIRHASRNGFSVEENTWKAIQRHGEKLQLCPVSRIRDELFNDLKSRSSKEWVKLAILSGLFPVIFPCYEQQLSHMQDNNGTTIQDNQSLSDLLNIFKVIDRLHQEGQSIPDHILLALILIPWAKEEMNLLQIAAQKKGDLFRLSRNIRQRLDEIFTYLNIKNSAKEAIAILLSLLPVFVNNNKKKGWPKWLTRKSYFGDGYQFFKIYRESTGGKAIDRVKVTSLPVRKRRTPGRPSRTPAIIKSRSGIFGLKKK